MEVLIEDESAEEPFEARGASIPRGAGEVIDEGRVIGDVLKAAEVLSELVRELKESVAVGTCARARVKRGNFGGGSRLGSNGAAR